MRAAPVLILLAALLTVVAPASAAFNPAYEARNFNKAIDATDANLFSTYYDSPIVTGACALPTDPRSDRSSVAG